MVGVGRFACFLGGRSMWLVPVAFVAMMALGGAVGFAGVGLPFVDTGIALSIVVIGGALAPGLSPPAIAALALVGTFAVFPGHAHGAAMPAAASCLAYCLRFLPAAAFYRKSPRLNSR